MLERTAILDPSNMAVAVGDEVICTGWGGTIWYAGHVKAQKTVQKKVMWDVYFGADNTRSFIELSPKQYGKAPTKPGDPEQNEFAWMFVVPAAASVEAVDAATMPQKSRGTNDTPARLQGRTVQSAQPSTVNTGFTELQKRIQVNYQKHLCNICKEPLDIAYEVDHIIPRSKGGGNDPENCQVLCTRCHAMKTKNMHLSTKWQFYYNYEDKEWQQQKR